MAQTITVDRIIAACENGEYIHTPWGEAQSTKNVQPGVIWVATASHGGLKVDREVNATIPAYLRRRSGWYEEDCEWALAHVGLGLPDPDGAARHTLRAWYPAAYERHYGVTLQPGDSVKRDEELFTARHANDWVVISAYGDWASGVPAGFVGAVATRGGARHYGVETKRFLVPAADYDAREHFGYVIPEGAEEVQVDFGR